MNRVLPCGDLRCRIGLARSGLGGAAGGVPPAQPHHTAATSIAPPATIHCFIISILLAACRFFCTSTLAFGFEAVMLASRTGRGRLRISAVATRSEPGPLRLAAVGGTQGSRGEPRPPFSRREPNLLERVDDQRAGVLLHVLVGPPNIGG